MIVCAVFVFSSCDNRHEPEYTPGFSPTPSRPAMIYILGVHPLHNPKRLYEIFSPITDFLSQQIPDAVFRVEASRSYAAYDKKLCAGHFHFALPNPYQTLISLKHGYTVFGKMADDENFRGIILVRKDSRIGQVSDLKGKAVSFPAATALAATMMPQYYLQSHGLAVMHDIEIRYVGSQESSIMNVYLGNTAAGATWPPPWRALVRERPELEAALEVKWSTSSLPNNGLVARNDMPEALVQQVGRLLFSLHTHEPGKKWLKRMELSRFEAADNAVYLPVLEFLQKFNQNVRPIDF
ncbi:MAG: phosphate/phosphite/phosphonate ABC transporter substrate-binding protein [Deltaproteobacteria bacterium]|nr:phosphate/phosphite/phosphonate ABC transporter substrate-binding protein [Deltaproteobacteria bacterium]